MRGGGSPWWGVGGEQVGPEGRETQPGGGGRRWAYRRLWY